MKLTDEHVAAMRDLATKAKEFSKNKNLTRAHREECKMEARVYSEIVVFLSEAIKK